MPWYAVRTKPRKEELARVNYLNQGIEVYLPLMRCQVRHARRVKKVARPVFPGYLFVQVDPEICDWVAVASTRGAVGPVSFGGCFPPVPDWVVESLRSREDAHGLVIPAELYKDRLQSGQKVEVTLKGHGSIQGVFCGFKGSDNVEVLLDILKRQVRASVPLQSVHPL